MKKEQTEIEDCEIVTVTDLDAVISRAKAHVDAATHHLRKGCREALLAGMHLAWLHRETAESGARNDLVPNGTRLGFEGACEIVGVKKRTAYRWMNALGAAVVQIGLIEADEQVADFLPDLDSREWAEWDNALTDLSEGMSVNRLLLGAQQGQTDVARLNDLIGAVEGGSDRAEALVQSVEDGQYTLAQAVRALGSQEAYDKLRREGGEKMRHDPVYLDLDGRTGECVGLLPKSIATIANGFAKWRTLPEPARKKLRGLWQELVAVMPEELAGR